jgi:TolB-like protein
VDCAVARSIDEDARRKDGSVPQKLHDAGLNGGPLSRIRGTPRRGSPVLSYQAMQEGVIKKFAEIWDVKPQELLVNGFGLTLPDQQVVPLSDCATETLRPAGNPTTAVISSPPRPPSDDRTEPSLRGGNRDKPSPGPSPEPLANRTAAQEFRHQPSIAVLPFRNLSGTSAPGHLADGLVEELIQALTRVPNFFVISRLSSMTFRDQNRLPSDIGEALGVQYIISGSLRVIKDRIRLTVELADTRSGGALWASSIDERFSDLVDVQERLAYAIVRSVGPSVHSTELKRAREAVRRSWGL